MVSLPAFDGGTALFNNCCFVCLVILQIHMTHTKTHVYAINISLFYRDWLSPPDPLRFCRHLLLLLVQVTEFFGDEVAGLCQQPTYWVNFLREPIFDPDTGEELEAAPVVYEPAETIDQLRLRLLGAQKQFKDSNKVRFRTQSMWPSARRVGMVRQFFEHRDALASGI